MKITPEIVTSLGLDEYDPRRKKEKLYALLLERQRRMALSSLYYFSKYVLGFSDIELQPHWELCRFLEINDGEDLLILLPRGTFKSSIISVAFPLWKLVHDRNLRFLLSSGELTNSKNFLGLISDHITKNDRFSRLFGDLSGKKSDTWTKTSIALEGRNTLRAEDSITASSYKVTKVSQHYDYAILDDLHNEKNVNTKDLIDEVWNYIQLALPLLDPVKRGKTIRPGPRIIVGTRWHFFDTYGRIIAEEQTRKKNEQEPQWKVLVRKERFTNGKLYFPSRLSETFLEKMRGSMSRNNYSCQYRNDPLPDEDQIFKLSNLGWYWIDPFGRGQRVLHGLITEMPTLLDKFSTIDPSIGEKEESDYTAIVTNAMDTEYNYYCWEVIRDHFVGNDAIIDEMIAAYKRNQSLRMGLETTAFQKSLLWGFQKKCRESGFWFPLQELHTDTLKSKSMRIQGFEPFVTGGRFYVRVEPNTDLTLSPEELYYSLLPGQDILVDEMIRFPKGGTMDCIDAQAYMPQVAYPAVVPPPPGPDPMSFMEIRRRLLLGSRPSGTLPMR